MADYSGYYRCDECNRDGNYVNPVQHLPTCGSPGRIAAARRKAENEKEAKRLAREKILDVWSAFDDGTLLVELRTLHDTMTDVEKYLTELDTEFKVGLSIINERDLLREYLRRD